MRDFIFVGFMALLLVVAAGRPFVGILVWSWISFMSAHRLVWGFATSLPWAILAFGATIIGCLVAQEPKRFRFTAILALFAVFAAFITLTTAISIAPPGVSFKMYDRVMKIILVLFLTSFLLTERWRVHAMVWLIVISLGFFGVRGGIFTLMTGGGFRVLGPPDSMIADRNHLAVALLIAIPLMNWLRMHSAHRIVRWGLVAAMVLTLFAVVGSQSRGALLGLAAVALTLWWRVPNKFVSGTVLAVALAGVLAFMPQTWVDRMWTIETYGEDASAMGRVNMWRAAVDIAVARPLGSGFRAAYSQEVVDRYSPGIRARATHSIYFEVIADHGFVGFAIWSLILATGVWYSLRIVSLSRDRPDLKWASDLARMSQVSIVAYMSGGAFLSLSYWDVFWTLLIILGAVHVMVRDAVQVPARAPALQAPRAGAGAAGGGWRGGPMPARSAPKV
jgi:probable O-glycosylation ligase (exosortase A-associated)